MGWNDPLESPIYPVARNGGPMRWVRAAHSNLRDVVRLSIPHLLDVVLLDLAVKRALADAKLLCSVAPPVTVL